MDGGFYFLCGCGYCVYVFVWCRDWVIGYGDGEVFGGEVVEECVVVDGERVVVYVIMVVVGKF